MKRKVLIAVCGIILGAGLLAGCANTPENSVVKQKGTSSLGNYEEGETLKSVGDDSSESGAADGGEESETAASEEESEATDSAEESGTENGSGESAESGAGTGGTESEAVGDSVSGDDNQTAVDSEASDDYAESEAADEINDSHQTAADNEATDTNADSEAMEPNADSEATDTNMDSEAPDDSADSETADDSGDGGTADNTGDSSTNAFTQNALQLALGAPESYQSEVSDNTGRLEIVTDAAVEIPDATQVSSIWVTQHAFDQDTIDRILEAFFPDAAIYAGVSYSQMTKSEYLEEIEALKGYVAEGNLDPYGWGTDESGEYYYDIYAEIEAAEESYELAPETKEMEEVHPEFGLMVEYIYDGDTYTYTYTDIFKGAAVMPDGTVYEFELDRSDELFPMSVTIHKVQSWVGYSSEYREWTGYEEMTSWGVDIPDSDEVKAALNLTPEEAQAAADEKVALLGLENMELASWEYGLTFKTDMEISRDTWDGTGYILYYTRKLNGIPITYTTALNGETIVADAERQPWAYETLEIVVTEDGIDSVKLLNQYDIGETKTENLNLLSFDEIMEIYEKMMLIQNADDAMGGNDLTTYQVDRIVFGYARIYEPSMDDRTGLLVPVWDFFGGVKTQWKDSVSVRTYPYDSFLTINAVDGTVIDRETGY